MKHNDLLFEVGLESFYFYFNLNKYRLLYGYPLTNNFHPLNKRHTLLLSKLLRNLLLGDKRMVFCSLNPGSFILKTNSQNTLEITIYSVSFVLIKKRFLTNNPFSLITVANNSLIVILKLYILYIKFSFLRMFIILYFVFF